MAERTDAFLDFSTCRVVRRLAGASVECGCSTGACASGKREREVLSALRGFIRYPLYRMPQTFVFDWYERETLSVHAQRCERGSGLEVRLIDESDGQEYTAVSLDVEIQDLADDEFVFKTFNCHHLLLAAMLEEGIVELTGRFVPVGAVGPQPVCRLLQR